MFSNAIIGRKIKEKFEEIYCTDQKSKKKKNKIKKKRQKGFGLKP